MQIARQRGERRIIRKALEQLADVGDPEGALEAHANVAPTLRKAQNALLNQLSVISCQLPVGICTPVVRPSWLLTTGYFQPRFDLCGGEPAHADDFISAAFPGGYRNRRTWHIQNFSQESDASQVGPSFYWRCSQGEFQRVANLAGDGVLLRPGM